MHKMVILCLLILFTWSCTDEFNLPEYETVDDTESPVILVTSPTEDQVITGQNQVAIRVDFTDDTELVEVQYQLVPNNVSGPSILMTKMVNDSTFMIDTSYTFPSSDSITYDVLIIASDIVNNVSTKSYQFTSK